MKPVRSIKNQYLGINAHLHSYWQSEGGWSGFHTNHFERYSTIDQARIAARMVAVLEAAHNGIGLESGPFPTKPIDLETALLQIEALKV